MAGETDHVVEVAESCCYCWRLDWGRLHGEKYGETEAFVVWE